jgi:hypothetical protein
VLQKRHPGSRLLPCLLDAWEGLQLQQIGLGSFVVSEPSGHFAYRALVVSAAPENERENELIDYPHCLALDLRSMVFLRSSITSRSQRDVWLAGQGCTAGGV